MDEAPSAGEMAARLLVSTPLALCQKKSVMMDRVNPNHHHGSLRGFTALASPGERLLRGPWSDLPSKNQTRGRGPPSRGGDGDMFPTSELKTAGPRRKGCRR